MTDKIGLLLDVGFIVVALAIFMGWGVEANHDLGIILMVMGQGALTRSVMERKRS